MTLPPEQMGATDHGGGVARAARELGLPPEALLDFSASINPLGMPPTVLAAAQASLSRAVHYPEIDAAALREALAAHHGLPPARLLPAAGSTELIYLLPRVLRPRRALLVRPAFSEYARSLAAAGIPWDGFDLHPEEGFALDPKRLLAALRPETELVLVANPGNPHGTGIDPQRLETIATALRGQALLVVDEAFIDFCPERSLLSRVAAHDNLYVLRSLTKFYAIPGLRAGFLAGPEQGVARLAAAREPWTLSTPALAAAEACLAAADYRRATATLLPLLRQELAAGLEALGLKVFPCVANFLLARLPAPAPAGSEITAALYRQGVLVRSCANFPPLDDRYLRLAVRTATEQQRLVALLERVLALPGGGES
ncbi:L-threonine-0-3-phosphate decarboxylase [Desulfuromonas sp. DDH964]|uniref:threonine-phosphate decarboxylase CobD n=1 Tax=Desulfuromonas sp. DDH964 TaxID=1823759 RepID=UPI00078C1B8D|nr:threonine-phosphate decarboxylase CobD [Desulfuromonas sp. DDH964]AMV73390.1 L-threonine-0-3-phosphate decarboxylase [Desulfuromonas sp. DDH964]